MSLLSFNFSKGANLFEILIWYCLQTSSSLSFLRFKSFHIKLLCCLFTYCQSFPYFCNHQIVISITFISPERSYIEYTRMSFLSIHIWLLWLWVCPLGEVQLYLWMFQCRNIVLLTARFFDVAKFAIQIPYSLLYWCRLSFPIVGLKIPSLPSFALKSPNGIFVWYLGKWSKTCCNSL